MKATGATRALLLLFAASLGWGCGAGLTLGPSFPTNRARDVAKVMHRLSSAPPQQSGPPSIILVTEAPPGLASLNLATGRLAWQVKAPVRSRVVQHGAVLVHLGEGDQLVGRSAATGQELWSAPLEEPGELTGLAIDETGLYYTLGAAGNQGSTPNARLVALDANTGSHRWTRAAAGELGAPAARAGVVFVPFRRQSIAALDGDRGEELARVLSRVEAPLWVTTSAGGPIVYGGREEVRRFGLGPGVGAAPVPVGTEPALAGAGSITGAIPAMQQIEVPLWPNGYYQAASYTAYDRAKLLWRLQALTGDATQFLNGLVYLQYYRFLFAYELPRSGSGKPLSSKSLSSKSLGDRQGSGLAWALHVGRQDIVGSIHAGQALVIVNRAGEVITLDPVSGAQFERFRTGLLVKGATFAAEGYRPPTSAQASPEPILQALMSILMDPDRRFDSMKAFCVEQIARLPGVEASAALLRVVQEQVGPRQVQRVAGRRLIERQDEDAIPLYIEALGTRYSYVDGARPRGLGVLAGALARLKPVDAVQPLVSHLIDHETPSTALRPILAALDAIGDASALPAVREWLLTYRCEPRFAGNVEVLESAARFLLDLGGKSDRELLEFIANDARTIDRLRVYVASQLSEPATSRPVPASGQRPANEGDGDKGDSDKGDSDKGDSDKGDGHVGDRDSAARSVREPSGGIQRQP